jgi:hypothetical protein
MAYRINVKGGIIPVRLNPLSEYSSFKDPRFIPFLLKVRKGEIRVIRLNDDSRILVRADSFNKRTDEIYNERATKLLHDKSNQKTAIIKGPVIVMLPEDWNA